MFLSHVYQEYWLTACQSVFCLEESSVSQVAATFKMDYNLLYSALCSTLRDDQTTLLLYLLIHRNSGVKAFIFSRTNIDQLVGALSLLGAYLSLSLSLLSYDIILNTKMNDGNLTNVIYVIVKDICTCNVE